MVFAGQVSRRRTYACRPRAGLRARRGIRSPENKVLTSGDKVKRHIGQITPGPLVRVATGGVFVVLRTRDDRG